MPTIERRTFFKKGLLAAAGLTLIPEAVQQLGATPLHGRDNFTATRPVVFTHTTVITGNANRAALKDVALAIRGNVIADIGPTDAVLKKFPDADVIDGQNKALLPGIVNC